MNEYSFNTGVDVGPESPNDPGTRASRRRVAILDAAEFVFAERGYNGATIAAVARRAGVADGTIYNYFADKRAVLVGLIDRLAAAEGQKVDLGRRPRADFADLVHAHVRQRFETLWKHRDLLRGVLPELLVDPALRRHYFTEVVEPAQRRGAGAVRQAVAADGLGDIDAEQFARVVAGAALGVLVLGLLGDEALHDDCSACAAATADLLLGGLRVEGG